MLFKLLLFSLLKFCGQLLFSLFIEFQFSFISTYGILVLVHPNQNFNFESSEVISLRIKSKAY